MIKTIKRKQSQVGPIKLKESKNKQAMKYNYAFLNCHFINRPYETIIELKDNTMIVNGALVCPLRYITKQIMDLILKELKKEAKTKKAVKRGK